MDSREFTRIVGLLKNVYPRITYIDDPQSSDVFFNILNRYAYEDIWQGVKNLVEIERYAPPISTVVQYVEEAEKMRKEALKRMSSQERDKHTVKCKKCNDAGFVWVRFKDGTEVARICDCETAREENPWAFMSDEAYEQAHEQQRKRGQNPPNGKPGHPTDWWIEQCGEVTAVYPGRRPPDKIVKR